MPSQKNSWAVVVGFTILFAFAAFINGYKVIGVILLILAVLRFARWFFTDK